MSRSKHRKYAAYIGRFQTWHAGHEWLIQQKIAQGKPILLLVRDVEPDEHNPKSGQQVRDELKARFRRSPNVKVRLIQDIESINYGRDVGYEVNEWNPPAQIAEISGTKIRQHMVSSSLDSTDPAPPLLPES